MQYKSTPIGEIPVNWEVKSLGELGEFKSGSGFPIDEQGGSNGVPFYKVSDMNLPENEIFMNISNNYISEEQVLKLKLKPINKEAIIFAKVGAAIFLERKRLAKCFLIDNNMMALVPKIPSFYLKYYLDFIRLSKYAQTGALPAYNASDLKIIQIPIPPHPEQNKIADILSTWDKAIQQTQSLVQKLELRNKALAFSLLRGKLVNKNSKKISLSKFLTFTPREIEKPTENYLALGIRSHGKGIFHKPDSDPKAIAMDKLYEVKENDFIVNITFAWEHAVAIISKEDEGGLVSHRFPTYVIDQKTVSVEFFRHIILQPFFKQMLDNISPGGAGRNRVLSKKDLLKLEISVPSLEEQTAIAEILNTAQQELKQYQEKLKALQQQKKGLMQQLLTGKLRTI